MEEVLRAIVLGLVQGITEFLPISSSGHLMLFPWLLGWDPHPLAFDVALHGGSLAAVLAYYQRDFRRMGKALLTGIAERDLRNDPDRHMAIMVIIATIPAAVIGFVFEDSVEGMNDRPLLIGLMLLVTGLLLTAAHHHRATRPAERVGLRDTIVVGVAQAFAVLPGISRAGATIAAGIFRGIAPAQAARFSFYMSVPIILGAIVSKAPDLIRGDTGDIGPVALSAGVLASAISAFIAIHFLLRLLANRRMMPFAVYCFLAGTLIVSLVALGR